MNNDGFIDVIEDVPNERSFHSENELLDQTEEFKKTVGRFIQKREREKSNRILIFEIDSTKDCIGTYKELTLRSLLSEVLNEIELIEITGNTAPSSSGGKKSNIAKCQSESDVTNLAIFKEKQKAANATESSPEIPIQLSQVSHPPAYEIPNPNLGMSMQRRGSGTRDINVSSLQGGARLSTNKILHASTSSSNVMFAPYLSAPDSARSVPVALAPDTMTYAVLGLRMRDLRRLDFTINPNEELTVQVRRNVVLFTVDPLRAVVTSQKLRIIVPPGGDTELTMLEQYMREWMYDKGSLISASSSHPSLVGIQGGKVKDDSNNNVHSDRINLLLKESRSRPAAISMSQNVGSMMSHFMYHREQQERHKAVLYGTGTIDDTVNLVPSEQQQYDPVLPSSNSEHESEHNNFDSSGHVSEKEETTPTPRDMTTNNTSSPANDDKHKDSYHFHQNFEIHAYESLLSTVKDILSEQRDSLSKRASNVIAYIRTGALMTPKVQERLNFLKDQTSKMASKLKHYRQSLDDVIEDDETMALMNLTSFRKNQKFYSYPLQPAILLQHEEIEEALEDYLTDFSAFESKVEFLQGQMNNAESQASLRLDINRNRTLSANIIITLLTLNVGLGAYFAGIFGMNLDNVDTIQPVPGVFPAVFAGSFALMIIGSIIMYYMFVHWGVIQTVDKALEYKYLH